MTTYTFYGLLSYMCCRIWKTVQALPKTLKVGYTSCVAAKIFLFCFFYIYFFRRRTSNTQGPYALGPCDDMGPMSSELLSVVTYSYYYIDGDIVRAIEPWLYASRAPRVVKPIQTPV